MGVINETEYRLRNEYLSTKVLFYKRGITNTKNGGLIKPDKNVTRKEKYIPISLININERDLNARLANCYIKKIIHHKQVKFIPEMQLF